MLWEVTHCLQATTKKHTKEVPIVSILTNNNYNHTKRNVKLCIKEWNIILLPLNCALTLAIFSSIVSWINTIKKIGSHIKVRKRVSEREKELSIEIVIYVYNGKITRKWILLLIFYFVWLRNMFYVCDILI